MRTNTPRNLSLLDLIAEEQHARSDGTIGLQRIKEAGGLAVVQEPTEAAYEGMPQNAIATGLVDLILPIAAMPTRLRDYALSDPHPI